MRLRLMGLRVTHIVSTKKPGIDFFGRVKLPETVTKPVKAANDGDWETWPEEEFEEAARQERNDEMNELEKLSQEQEAQEEGDIPMGETDQPEAAAEEQWACPICTLPQPPDDATFNAHIDFCLSKDTIKEAVKSTAPTAPSLEKQPSVSKTVSKKGKRGRPKNEPVPSEQQASEGPHCRPQFCTYR
jgi:DNA polymerase kappa